MTPELLHLYKELYKTVAYIYRTHKQPVLDLVAINKPQISLKNQFGVPDVRKQLLCYLCGLEIMQRTWAETELLLPQLPVMQYRGNKPCSNLPELSLFVRVVRVQISGHS
jgi:hypothetical protein